MMTETNICKKLSKNKPNLYARMRGKSMIVLVFVGLYYLII